MLTTQEAAAVLNVSRPTICKMIDEKTLKATKVGTHRRIAARDLMAYSDTSYPSAIEACNELARMSKKKGDAK
jgi:excisionase family DNA binding protein